MTVTDEHLQSAGAGMLAALSELASPAPVSGPSSAETGPDAALTEADVTAAFAAISAHLHRLKHLTSLPTSENALASAGLQHFREQVGLAPPSQADLARARFDLASEWRNVTPPAAEVRKALAFPEVAASPHGQRMGAIYATLTELDAKVRAVAGRAYSRLLADGRMQTFLAVAGARITHSIATAAAAAHDTLQRLDGHMSNIAATYQRRDALTTLQNLRQVREGSDHGAGQNTDLPAKAHPAPAPAAAPTPQPAATTPSATPARPPGRAAAAQRVSPTAGVVGAVPPRTSPRRPAAPAIPPQSRRPGPCR
ncbi:hypothetical protein GCM10010156_66420 [Planobispora rosea]|uniref:Uncharacterized protein n=1 Tax=Planobispora rosea TaxID=35762 RepID=A0A8J3S774_PLARO|nr:hypothetical protein [Planobispora rosea]GGS99002.1 hypothetical protein GCM10010156_66420 [Planobispora rosea]GIH88005.1 hypothetical protein Pro02_64130 [Planobispora rosea]